MSKESARSISSTSTNSEPGSTEPTSGARRLSALGVSDTRISAHCKSCGQTYAELVILKAPTLQFNWVGYCYKHLGQRQELL